MPKFQSLKSMTQRERSRSLSLNSRKQLRPRKRHSTSSLPPDVRSLRPLSEIKKLNSQRLKTSTVQLLARQSKKPRER